MGKLSGRSKKITIDVLAYSDLADSATGQKTRSWQVTSITYRIINEEKYAGMSLSTLTTFHKSQTLAPQKAVRVFLHHELDVMRGATTQEIGSNDAIEGLIIERGKMKAISNDEALELLKMGDYQIRLIQGTNLVLPPVMEQD